MRLSCSIPVNFSSSLRSSLSTLASSPAFQHIYVIARHEQLVRVKHQQETDLPTTHTHVLICSHTHVPIRPHTHTSPYVHTHTHTHTHTRPHTSTHTRPHITAIRPCEMPTLLSFDDRSKSFEVRRMQIESERHYWFATRQFMASLYVAKENGGRWNVAGSVAPLSRCCCCNRLLRLRRLLWVWLRFH